MKLEAARLYTTVYSTVNYLLQWTAPGGGKAVSFGCSLTPRREAPRGRPHSGSSGSSGSSDKSPVLCSGTVLQHWCTAAHLSTCAWKELTTGPTCTVSFSCNCCAHLSDPACKTVPRYKIQDQLPAQTIIYYDTVYVSPTPYNIHRKPLWAVTCSSAVWFVISCYCLSKAARSASNVTSDGVFLVCI